MENNTPTLVELEDKIDYYKDNEAISFSTLKVFSRCETLYKDMYIDKTYEEGDHDYFTYGKVVDAMLTENSKFMEENFMLVDRKIKAEDALRIENQLTELQNYINDPAFQEKLAKGNLTAKKGLEKREKEIKECEEKLNLIASIATKVQVTPAIWREAEETALAIKTHPSFVNLTFNHLTSQQIFRLNINGILRKGKLDHLKLSPEMEKLYGIYKAKKFTHEELKQKISELNINDKWAIITDIKTCYSMEKLEPYQAHYRGQLGFYQDLVSAFFGIPTKSIRCRILAGDKRSNEFKISELFEYTQDAIDELKPDVDQWVVKWDSAMKTRIFISDKAKNGMKQTCFKCSQCRHCPFSNIPGDPVMISAPRFGDTYTAKPTITSQESTEY